MKIDTVTLFKKCQLYLEFAKILNNITDKLLFLLLAWKHQEWSFPSEKTYSLFTNPALLQMEHFSEPIFYLTLKYKTIVFEIYQI